jgi:predicted DNA-binding transcriptional regulator AlpA
MKLPKLLSSKQVGEKIGVSRENMAHKRKTKGFPQPKLIVDKFPLWLESDIDAWLESKTKKEVQP